MKLQTKLGLPFDEELKYMATHYPFMGIDGKEEEIDDIEFFVQSAIAHVNAGNALYIQTTEDGLWFLALEPSNQIVMTPMEDFFGRLVKNDIISTPQQEEENTPIINTPSPNKRMMGIGLRILQIVLAMEATISTLDMKKLVDNPLSIFVLEHDIDNRITITIMEV